MPPSPHTLHPMPTSSAAAVAALSLSVFHPHPRISLPTVSPRHPPQPRTARLSCHVALTTDVPSSSLSESDAGEAKVGRRIRVTAPLKVYHVTKAPDLDLKGLEGTVKQYVAFWKGKPISANLPFKVEFLVPVDGQPKPVKFFAHLKEDEFEFLDSGSD